MKVRGKGWLRGLSIGWLLVSLKVFGAPVTFLAQDSQPKYFLDKGVLSGLCGELYQALAQELKQDHIMTEAHAGYLPIKRILGLVEMEPGHVFCGSGRNAEREKRFSFASVPLYHVSNVVVARQGDSFVPKSFEDIVASGEVVGALYGTSSARYLKQQIGTLVNDSFNDFDTPLKLIATPPHRLRFFYYHDLGLNYLVKTSPYPLQVVPTKFRTVPQWLIYSNKTSPEIASAIESALLRMKTSGELERIVGRYIY